MHKFTSGERLTIGQAIDIAIEQAARHEVPERRLAAFFGAITGMAWRNTSELYDRLHAQKPESSASTASNQE